MEGAFFAIILSMILKRLRLAFFLLVIVVLLGISGYIVIEGWGFLDALYMTVITIASVGFMEVNPLSPQGRIFTIFLIIFGMGILLFGISTLTAFLVEGELSEILRRRTMERTIAHLKGHYIVCGIGRLGKHIIDELYKTKRPFVAIDIHEGVCKDLADKGMLYIKGDATSSVILKAANAEQAKGLFCALRNDADNLLLIFTAKGINPHIRVVAKAEEGESEEKMRKAGADRVVLPEFIGGLRMASEMIRPEAVTFLDQMLKGKEIYRVEDIPIPPESAFIGKTLKSSGLVKKEGVTIGAVRKGDKYLFNPPDSITLDSGDALILIGETNEIREIKKLAG
jgi:voltage-gated potassium channel